MGESITEGILARWLKPDGGTVKAGEPLFELETDKASSVVPAPSSGVLKIGVAEGDDGRHRRDRRHDRPGRDSAAAAERLRRPAPPTATASAASARPQTCRRPARPRRLPQHRRLAASRPLSPAVRRMVAEEGVDVARVAATGPGGRVTKGDVLAYLESPRTARAEPRRPRAGPSRRAGPGPAADPAKSGRSAKPASA